jgi:hypothetical protein
MSQAAWSRPAPAADEEHMELTILMPCLNEAETVGACVDTARAYLERTGIQGEVVVADNGSTDASALIARARGARVVLARERGYGAAIRAGIKAARGDYVIVGDADGSYDFAALDDFVSALRDGADLVMGNRFAGGIEPGAMPALHRYFGNPFLSTIGRLFFRAPIHDFHCGLRGFRRSAMLDLSLRTSGMEFASEMIVRSQLARLRLAEVPTVLRPAGRSRPPHLHSFRDGWRHLRFLLLYSPRWLLFYPGVLLLLFGVTSLVLAWRLPATTRPGVVLQSTLYGSGSVGLGYTIILFAVVARTFAVTEDLMPLSGTVRRLYRWIHLETGLGLGLLMVAAGFASAGWVSAHHGATLQTQIDVAVPAVTTVLLGVETAAVSFVLSLLGMRRSSAASRETVGGQ